MTFINDTVVHAVASIMGGHSISRETSRRLLDVPLYDFLHGADRLREEFFGKKVCLCAVINARSGLCGEDCAFCPQSARHAAGAPVYPMRGKDVILEKAAEARRMGAARFGIVTSGFGLRPDDREKVRAAIKALTRRGMISPCASLGEIDGRAAGSLRLAGLVRYHHNLESSERFFPRLCTTHRWADRVRTIRAAREAGLEVCAGGVFGVGENWDDRIELAFSLRELRVDAVPLNFLIPLEGTPMQSRRPLAPREALRIIALFRYILPDREIKVAGGREFVLGDLQSWIFFAGASGMMIGGYLTTRGRRPEEDLRMIEQLGLQPVSGSTPAEEA